MQIIFYIALIGGGIMAWAVGANDVANAMGTSVGSKAISIKKAIIIAALFETLGAVLSSQEVTQTIQRGLVPVAYYANDPMTLVYGMSAALYASAFWLILASTRGWPVSTTHSIIGAVVGFGVATQGMGSLPWDAVRVVAVGWVVTPLASALVSWSVFRLMQIFIFSRSDPLALMTRYAPVAVALISLPIFKLVFEGSYSIMGVSSDLDYELYVVVALSSLVSWWVASRLIAGYSFDQSTVSATLESIERVFALLVVVSACVMAFSHGANDVANAIGPMALIFDILSDGRLSDVANTPPIIVLYGAVGVSLGVCMYGYRVMERVGSGITVLSPSRSFAAQLSTGIIVLTASFLGFPVSTTQTLVGGVLGVGLARGLAAVDLAIVRGIFFSWMITIPTGALLSIFFFHLFQWVL